MTHTQGKLIGVPADTSHGHYIEDEAGSTVCDLYCMSNGKRFDFHNAEGNRRRLVACWNACEDEELDYLEGIVSLGSSLRKEMEKALTTKEQYQTELCAMEAEHDALKQTNAELLDLLRKVSGSFTNDDDLPNILLPRIDAAIARAEGGQQI